MNKNINKNYNFIPGTYGEDKWERTIDDEIEYLFPDDECLIDNSGEEQEVIDFDMYI